MDIFIPYWGDPVLMKATVNSVLAQTDPDWHLTIVDDAYPDLEIQQWVAKLDDVRVTYIRHESNIGISANFQFCIDAASRDHFVVVGNDDLLEPSFVAEVKRGLSAFPDVDFIQPGVTVIDAAGKPARTLVDTVKQRVLAPRGDKAVVLTGERLGASLMHGDWLYWPSLVFRTASVQGLRMKDEFRILMDLAFITDLVMRDASLLVLPRKVFQYRRHAESLSSTALEDGSRFAEERAFFAAAARQFQRRGWRRARRAARLHVTSRLHALSLLPQALFRRSLAGMGVLLRHAFGPTGRPLS